MNFRKNCTRLSSRGLCLLGIACSIPSRLYYASILFNLELSSGLAGARRSRDSRSRLHHPFHCNRPGRGKQAVAGIFASVLIKERPKLRCLTLPETLNAINRASFTDDYRAMYGDYRDTGLFKRDVLQKIGEATKTRYVIQLKLSGSDGVQRTPERFWLKVDRYQARQYQTFCRSGIRRRDSSDGKGMRK